MHNSTFPAKKSNVEFTVGFAKRRHKKRYNYWTHGDTVLTTDGNVSLAKHHALKSCSHVSREKCTKVSLQNS